MTWFLDGVNLSTLAFNIRNRSAGWAVPGKSGGNIRVPGKHGAFWVPNKTFEEGHLTLSMWAAGCNEDGTLPHSDDGKRKVRENLDKLTSMFSNSHRLLNLRQQTGTDMALINEVTNPTLTSTTNSGYTLATNHVVDADRKEATTVEISRNIHTNPYMKGREGSEVVVTEDLYPDPGLVQHQSDPVKAFLQSYYYPINQDIATHNQFFRGSNGFSLITGVNGGRGIFRINQSPNWTGDANIGWLGRDVYADRADGVVMFANLKLSAASPQESLTLQILPSISYDGSTWTDGTPSTHTITKSAYSWVIIPPTRLPSMSGAGKFFVQYRFRIVGGSSWTTGGAFDIQYLAIQDAPKAGNPWRDKINASHMIVGGDTPYVHLYGSSSLSWSGFRRSPAPEWEVVNTGATATTAPYAFAWSGKDTASQTNVGYLAFTVFGGTKNSFRRTLPVAQSSSNDVKIWGTCWSMNPTGPVVVRLLERSGSAGSYTYTTVGSVSIQSIEAFSSAPFSTTAGKTYVLEVEVPSSDAGMEPSIFFRDLHVSNAYVNTTIDSTTAPSVTWGVAARAYYPGGKYVSSVLGATYKVPGIEVGFPEVSASNYSTSGINWGTQVSGVYGQAGVIETEPMKIPSNLLSKTLSIRTKVALTTPYKVPTTGFLPASASVTMQVLLYNASGTLTRTLSQTLTSVNSVPKTFTYSASVNSDEVSAVVRFSYSNASYPMANIKVTELHVMVDKPSDITLFTGSTISTNSTWSKAAAWTGRGYFSESSLTTALSPHWRVDGFAGTDSDNYSLKFTGSTIRVKTANLPAGTAYVGYRRGTSTGTLTVSAKPEGAASATGLGTVTSGTNFVQGMVTIPAGTDYVDFIVTGGTGFRTVKDVFVIGSWQPAFPIPSSGWVGFTPSSNPTLVLPTHPSSLFPLTRVVRNSNKTLAFTTGDVPGWTGPVVSGGYLQVPKSGEVHTIAANPIRVNGGYASAAVKLQPANDAANRITIKIQAATNKEYDAGNWVTLSQKVVSTTDIQEVRLVDAAIGERRWARLVIEVSNTTTPLSRSGIMGIVDGATFTATPIPIGGNFPGHFIGVRASNGTSTYQGDIRQCFVEVTEAIDMDSMALGTIAEFNVNLTVPGAFWEDVYDTQATLVPSGTPKSGSFYVAAFEGATAPMNDLIIEVTPISGTLTDFRIEDKASGNYIEYNGPARTKVTINTTLATVVDERGNSVIRHVPSTGSSAIMSLTPYRRNTGETIANHINGTPILEWRANVPIKVTITGRRKYLIG